jgi:hypothetical protein
MNLYNFDKAYIVRDYETSYSKYGLRIEGGRPDSNGYVVMEHGQCYKVILENKTSKKCQASLKIDGNHIADYIMSPYQTIHIERPVDSFKKFTFYRADASYPLSSQTGIIAGKYENGVVEATFTPEKEFNYDIPIVALYDYSKPQYPYSNPYSDPYSNPYSNPNYKFESDNFDDSDILYNSHCHSNTSQLKSFCQRNASNYNYVEGGTALSGHSNQHFQTARGLNLDNFKQVTLSIRLVANNTSRTIIAEPRECIYVPPIDDYPYITRQVPPPPPPRFATPLPRLDINRDIQPLTKKWYDM